MDWDAGIWRYRSNDNVVEMIEDDHVALNFRENDLFILVFPREVKKGNNNSDIDIDNSFIKVSTISPLFLEYREYIDIFFESEAR